MDRSAFHLRDEVVQILFCKRRSEYCVIVIG